MVLGALFISVSFPLPAGRWFEATPRYQGKKEGSIIASLFCISTSGKYDN